MKRYNPSEIEPKWQQIWEDQKVNEVGVDADKQKIYVSGMFPYPSGAGMHTGHAFSYSIVDAIARFHRQHGRNVLNPMGWDTFGLPAENYAIKTGTAPAVITAENIANFKKQFKRMGVSIDWSREINTSDPEYYRWTQWIFTKLFERDLAYQKESLQWWCPVDKTVLANEQVEGGHCWRCGSLVEKKSMKQWFFRITNYAEALLDEIPDLEWPQKIKTAQTNWIGKSVGAEIGFKVDRSSEIITVFSTRPDTLFGATFVVLAPEHELVKKLAKGEFKDSVNQYVQAAIKKSEIDRMNDTHEKTGVFTGVYAINPISGEHVPIWVADYVLSGYGTGAIMAVPAHDKRDFAFAEKYNLPIMQVVANYRELDGPHAARDDMETKHRPTIDAIITDGNGRYLLQIEEDDRLKQVHFVGGGIEKSDDSVEAAVRREVLEETGYTALDIKQAAPFSSAFGFRHGKNRNQLTWGAYYEVVVDPSIQIASEIEEGKHTVEWVDKQDVAAKINWEGHATGWQAYLDGKVIDDQVREGIMVNSGEFDGRQSSEVREQIVAWLEKEGVGRSKTTYKMRDWLISRQRYWGAPIPIIHCPDHGPVAVPEDQLPVILPIVEDYAPKGDGKSALAGVYDWVNTTCPTCGGPAKRETDTMDGYACSSWYLLRYSDPKNSEQAWDPETVNYWNPVDYYVGGDHAVAHLLYVRFWTHIFNEMGLTDFKEPVKRLIYHGYINAEDGTKMSKSKGNVIDPLDVINQGYGADALRTYVLFMGPIEVDAAWSSKSIAGVYRFLNRIWVLAQEYLESDKSFTGNDDAVRRAQHKTIRRVTNDFNRLSFNTAISALMEYVNELYRLKVDGFSDETWKEALVALVQLLSPFAPHIGEELNKELSSQILVQNMPWPVWDDSLIVNETITMIVQVDGKLRAKLEFNKDASEDNIKELALADKNVQTFVGNKKPTKIIYVPGRLVNIVL
jgi:leucyl-tRNA synthetase